jgi:hypothetical protein
MKKIIITTLSFTFFLTQSFGQIKFGIKGGLNLANVKNIGLASNKVRFGFNGGVLTEILIGKKFIIQPELLYSVKGFKFPATEFNSTGTLSFNYISAPILGGYQASEKLTILAGPELSFLTNAKSRFDNTDHDVSKNFRKFDVAIDLGIKYNISNVFGIDLRYSFGFEDLMDVMFTDQFGDEIGKRRVGSNRVFQIGVFYKL